MDASNYGASSHAACVSQTQTQTQTALVPHRRMLYDREDRSATAAHPPPSYIERISCPIRRRFYEGMTGPYPEAQPRRFCRNTNIKEFMKENEKKKRLQNKPIQMSRPTGGQVTWRLKRTVVESIREWERHTREARRQNNYVPTVTRRKPKNAIEPQTTPRPKQYMQYSVSAHQNKTSAQPKRHVCEFHREQCPIHGSAGAGALPTASRRGRSESEPSLHSQGVQALLKQARKSVTCCKKCTNPRLYRNASQDVRIASVPKRHPKCMPLKNKPKPADKTEGRVISAKPYLKEILKDPALTPRAMYTNQNQVYKNTMFNNKQINTNEKDWCVDEGHNDVQKRSPRPAPHAPYFNQKLCYNCNCYRMAGPQLCKGPTRCPNKVTTVYSQRSLRRNVSSQMSVPFLASNVPVIIIKDPNSSLNKLLTKSDTMHVDIKPKEIGFRKVHYCDTDNRTIELPRRQSSVNFLAPIIKKISTLIPALVEMKKQNHCTPNITKNKHSDKLQEAKSTCLDIIQLLAQNVSMHRNEPVPASTPIPLSQTLYSVPTLSANYHEACERIENYSTSTFPDEVKDNTNNTAQTNHSTYSINKSDAVVNKPEAIINKSDAMINTVISQSDAYVNTVITKSESNQTITRIDQLSQPLERKTSKPVDRSRAKRLLTIAQRNKMWKRIKSRSTSPECKPRASHGNHTHAPAATDKNLTKQTDKNLTKPTHNNNKSPVKSDSSH